jgi:hypothetical protein
MAGSPGGHEVERISVKVVPDTSGFAKKLKKFLEKQEKTNKLNIEVELDTKAAEAKLKKLAKNLTVKLKVDIDATGVKAKIEALSKNQTAKIKADVDDTAAKRVLSNLEKNVQKRLSVKVDDVTAKVALDKLKAPIQKKVNVILDMARTNIKNDLDSLTRDRHVNIEADLDDLKAKVELDLLARDRKVNIKTDVDQSAFSKSLGTIGRSVSGIGRGIADWATKGFGPATEAAGKTSGAVSGVIGKLASMGAKFQGIGSVFTAVIYAVIIPAIAGLVIAIGGIAGALLLAFAPAIFIGAGIAFEVLTAKGKGTAQKLKDAFKDVAKTAKGVISDAIKPMTDAIEAQIPKLDKWIKTLKGPLKSAFTASSKYVDDFRVGFQKSIDNMFKGLTNALNNPALKPAIDGFKKLMGDIGTAIGLFFLTLANGGVDFGKTLGALGDALIKIAPALGNLLDAFAKVSPDLIGQMADGIVGILQAFSDPKTIAALTALSKISFIVIISSLEFLADSLHFATVAFNVLKVGSEETLNGLKTAWDSFVSFLKTLWDGLKTAASVTGSAISSAFWTSVHAIASAASSTWDGIKSVTKTAWNAVKSTVSTVVDAIVSVVKSKWDDLKRVTSSAIDGVKRFFSSLGDFVGRIAHDIHVAISGIIGAAQTAASWLSRVNPFGGTSTISVEDNTTGGLPPGFGFPTPAPMPLGGLFDFQADLNGMQADARKLNNLALNNSTKHNGLAAGVAGLAQKIYQFGDIITNEKTTPEAVADALTRLDALYGT